MDALVVSLAAALLTGIPSALVFLFSGSSRESRHFLMSLGAGGMLGSALFHLIPEAGSSLLGMAWVGASILAFFVAEKLLHWHGCHEEKCTSTHIGWMAVLGDVLHNFIDGMAIYASFLSGTASGIASSVSILVHEIPQEIGDMGILLGVGFSRKDAIKVNVLSSLTSLLGVFAAYLLRGMDLEWILLPLAAGSFIYISMADLTPEMHKSPDKGWLHVAGFAAGMAAMLALAMI